MVTFAKNFTTQQPNSTSGGLWPAVAAVQCQKQRHRRTTHHLGKRNGPLSLEVCSPNRKPPFSFIRVLVVIAGFIKGKPCLISSPSPMFQFPTKNLEPGVSSHLNSLDILAIGSLLPNILGTGRLQGLIKALVSGGWGG